MKAGLDIKQEGYELSRPVTVAPTYKPLYKERYTHEEKKAKM